VGLSDATIYDPVITATENTTYTVFLTDSTGLGCANSSSAQVNMHVKSLPQVDAGPDKFFTTGTNFSIAPNYSDDIVSYQWTPADGLSCSNCPTPAGTATRNQLYVIKVVSDSGCVFSDSLTVGVDCKNAYIMMPKAFSPNDDNLNDWFYPRTIGMKSIVRFTIFNRQGQVIYEARNFPPNNKENGWNGKFKGVNQPMNTYIYTIETICETGERLFKNDSFLLLR
jgi:gliding motility-associated-like protein